MALILALVLLGGSVPSVLRLSRYVQQLTA
jgi:hypothetical protein